jgi:hypothetical protein
MQILARKMGLAALSIALSLDTIMLEALQAAAVCGFAMGAMATGLAAARFFDRRQVENPVGP